jgi:uncharacterized low-complexity protein
MEWQSHFVLIFLFNFWRTMMNLSKTTLSLSLVAALGAAGTATAADNPFGLQSLDSGYVQLAEGKCGEGKCGTGKCGADKKKAEGKCGEGKCGADKKKEAEKAKEGKCGEGKCGAGK